MKESEMKSIQGFTKVKVKSFMQAKLRTDPKWAVRGVLRIYELQCPSERRNHTTRLENGLGFTIPDAPLLSALACKLRMHKDLTASELNKLMYRMPKYAMQLVNVSDEESLKKHLKKYYE